jgi:hypothetical protein
MGQAVEHSSRHFGIAKTCGQSAKARLVVMSSDVFS